MTWMSQAAYARRHGVSPKTATMWKKSGLIVVTEEGVDVETSDARLRRYRNEHDGRAQRGARKAAASVTCSNVTFIGRLEGNGRKGNGAIAPRVELPIPEIRRRLRKLDWKQPAPASGEERWERARLAARCLGLEAAESDLDDDGHWGGLQLRDPNWWGNQEAYPDQQVVAGFGFELTPLEVVLLCRREVDPEKDTFGDDGTYVVDLALLPALAYPHFEGQRPEPASVEKGMTR